jgi:murein DD-endopeptidase MepM/ murein hydrolase activator NlpD
MFFKKPRKLPHGKEIVRTTNFSLISLGNGNFHYSYTTNKKLIYGDIDFNQKKFRVYPLIILAMTVSGFLFFGNRDVDSAGSISPSRVSIFAPDEVDSEMDERDRMAKEADDSYLRETELQKKSFLQSDGVKFRTIQARSGETIEEIAQRYKVSTALVASKSNLPERLELKEGTPILIPEKPGIIHKFKQGDSLAKVASFYKVSIESVLVENNIESGDIFKVGDKIFLPGAEVPEPPPIWVAPVISRVITSGFGMRSFPRDQFHEAWDLKANYETVYAARSGIVTYSGWMGGYGNAIVVEHTKELKTLYAHNSRLFVREGEYIYGGKPISKSGCTGYCFGPHLHFEVIRNGVSVDPRYYLKGMGFYTK